MIITEFRNSFDLSQDRVEITAPAGLTFAQWHDEYYAGREHVVALVALEGQPLPREAWDQEFTGRQLYVLTKPGDPWTVAAVALSITSVALSVVMRPNIPKQQETSPTYSISAQQNAARLGAPVPVQYGRSRIWPDLLAQPFSVYNNNDQYLYQLFCLGAGEFELEGLQIDDTPVEAFSEIEYEVYYNEPVTLFPTDVVTSNEVGTQELTETFAGPFVASGVGTTANRLEIDLIWEAGLFRARSTGDTDPATTTLIAEYREITDAGAPIGTWQTLVAETFTEADRSPIRLTRGVDVPPGRYEVRVRRGEISQNGPKLFTRVIWQALRAYLEDEAKTYDELTVMAVRAKATGNLNQNSSRRFNIVGTRKLPIWNGTTWSDPVPTRSIAWACADIIRAEYGARRVDEMVDLDKLLALDALWEGRGDHFDYRFDVTLTAWEALKVAASAGRAHPITVNEKISFVRSQPQTIPATIFTRRNTNNFRVEYSLLTEESHDSIMAEYIEPGIGWKDHQVLCQPPGSAGLNPKRVKLPGIIDRAQAFREGITQAEMERKQRKVAKFSTELEGYIPSEGDLIAVVNEDFRYDQAGEVVSVSGTTITTTDDLEWKPGVSHFVRFRMPDGRPDGPHLVTPGTNTNQFVLGSPLDWEPYTGGEMVRTYYQFGELGELRSRFIVKEIKPRGGNTVEITAVNEVDSVHTVDQLPVPPDNLPGPIAHNEDGPVVRVLLVENTSNPAILHVAWSVAPGADYYILERSMDGGETWLTWTTTMDTQVQMPAPSGELHLRVAGVGRARGPWRTWIGTVGEYVIHSPENLSLHSELALTSAGDYVTNLVFEFDAPADDYHIVSFEAQYRLGRHIDWQPLFNALETRWEWQTAEIGIHQVRVRSVYIQDEVYSDWAEVSIASLGTYDAIAAIGVNPPIDPLLFITANPDKATADIRISTAYDDVPEGEIVPDRMVVFYAGAERPAMLRITEDAGDRLYIDPTESIAGQFVMDAAAGSTTTRIRYVNPGVDIDLSGMWWICIESQTHGWTRFYKIAESSTTELVLAAADELPYTPQAGDLIHVVELDWADSRLPEFRLLWCGAQDDPNGEVVRHNGIDFDQATERYYVDVEERGAEGTTQQNHSGREAHYFPALGPGTNAIEIFVSDFIWVDGQYIYSGTIPVNLPSRMTWAAVTCCLARRATAGESTQYVRSFIQPLIIAGPATT